MIADYSGAIGGPDALEAWLSSVPGVVAHGLFQPALVAEVIVGRGKKAESLKRAF